MLTGNKGEWSEIYTLLKIIADRQLSAGGGNLLQVDVLTFPIVKVLRDEPNGVYEYTYQNDLVIIKGEGQVFHIPIKRFQEEAAFLLSKLRRNTARTFSVPETEAFLQSFNCTSLKAKSSVKSDIRVVIHDQRTGMNSELGFSIKSQLGGASTLLNAGKTTNFIYAIKGCELAQSQVDEINAISSRSKIKDRIEQIQMLSGHLAFQSTASAIFGNNLMLIDSRLPQIIAELLYLYYTSRQSKTSELIKQVTVRNPLNFDLTTGHPFYVYKIKRLLTDIALGMMPSKVWTGQLDATGGYLVVKENGEILCYHIYNRNEFEDYLLHNTKLETASTSRHQFGTIFKTDQGLFFKLNLQIRFLK